jgi:hypothetical protein
LYPLLKFSQEKGHVIHGRLWFIPVVFAGYLELFMEVIGNAGQLPDAKSGWSGL